MDYYRCSLVICPRHVFIRFIKDDGTYINLETTSNRFSKQDIRTPSDAFYKKQFVVFQQSIDSGAHMKFLSEKEIFGILYQGTARYFNEIKEYQRAIELFEISLTYHPNLSESYFGYASALYELYKTENLEIPKLLQRGLQLYPNNTKAQKLLTSFKIKEEFNS